MSGPVDVLVDWFAPLSGMPRTTEVIAVVVTGLVVAAIVRMAVPPTPRLAPRLRPYTVASRASLGRGAGALDTVEAGAVLSGGTLMRLLGPPVERLALLVGRLVDNASEQALALRLRQAGLHPGVGENVRVREYRIRQLGGATFTGVVLGVAALVAGQHVLVAVGAFAGGAVIGAARGRGRVDRAIEDRRTRMRIELYTVNQLLAMHVRVGGGVVQGLQRVTDRCAGAVVDELSEVLRAHRTGRPLAAALAQAAATTPEPHAARTYKLLATGAEFGADLAEGLRSLSEDIRDERAEALKRTATKRRAAMLVPIIAVLAPVMLLFLAAPLPRIVVGAW